MKTSIRYNTFETNSSSVHAIVIDIREGYIHPENQNIFLNRVELEDYGRPHMQIFSDMSERINYIWSGVYNFYEMFGVDRTGQYGSWYTTEVFSKYHEYAKDLEVWRDKIRNSCDVGDEFEFMEKDEANEYRLYSWCGVDHPT